MLRMLLTPPQLPARKPRCFSLWITLALGLMAVFQLAGCRAPRLPRGQPEVAAVPALASTPTPVPVPTFTPTAVPILSEVPSPTQNGNRENSTAPKDSVPAPTVAVSDRTNELAGPAPSLWGALPLRTFVGEFANLSEHIGGQFSLIQTGPTVTAVFSSSHSPVQHYARTEPAVLFTLPVEFRPDARITWEVEGWPVPQDGQAIAEADGPHTFRMQVHPNGNVNYVDDAGVDGIGYLHYTVNLAWPALGAEPQVCTRTRAVQHAILKALAATDCAVLTWEQLASIRALDAQLEVSEGTDFAGLTGLESVSLEFGDVVPLPSTLAQLPRLRDLELMLNLQEALPEGFLSRNSHLKGLTIGSPYLTSLPAEFLAYIPQLTHLSLDIPQLEALPNHFLAQSPSLMSFRLNAPQLQTVSREVWTLLKAHSMQVVVVGPGQNFHTEPNSQSATEEWARPGQWLEIMTRLETEEGHWVQVKGHWQDFAVGDVSTFLDWRRWLEESHLAPAGIPFVTSGAVVEGRYGYQDLHPESGYRLQRTGATVIATFQVQSSPVQFLARTSPAILFTLPEVFRPAEEVVWEVEGWPVEIDDKAPAALTSSRGFRIRVQPDGAVSYVDDVGVDGVGHLQYRTSLAWPAAGTEPFVCLRSAEVQRAILGVLQLTDCAEVTWAQLGSIRQLEGFLAVSQPQDLAGLSGLESVALRLGDGLDLTAILAQMPQLLHLKLIVNYLETLPDHFLASLPQLESLALLSGGQFSLPPDFLVHTPQLEELHLGIAGGKSSGTRALPNTFLSPVPRLKRFHWFSLVDTALPPDLLKFTPGLQQLGLATHSLSELPADFLRCVPQLTELDIWTSQDLTLSADFLVPVPRLTRFRLVNGSETPLPFDFLVPAPRLKDLELWLGQRRALPTHFLAAVPRLNTLEVMLGWYLGGTDYLVRPTRTFSPSEPFSTDFLSNTPELASAKLWNKSDREGLPDSLPVQRLPTAPRVLRLSLQDAQGNHLSATRSESNLRFTLQDSELWELPDSFLQQAPSLNQLVVRSRDVMLLPADLLTKTPQLTHLILRTDYLAPLPHSWLSSVPDLSHLILELDHGETWPSGFLTLPPGITHLTIQAEKATSLPADWLPPSPGVTHLTVQVDDLRDLPRHLLAATPGLTHLFLHMGELTKLPKDFLTSVPNLTHLTIQAANLEELSQDLLVPTPQLTYLALHAPGLSAWPEQLLTSSHGLTHMILLVDGLRSLPHDLLELLPGLYHFYLQADGLDTLPADFLIQAPDLTFLTLQVDNLTELPEGFLEQAPALTHLVLKANQLTELPEDFLQQRSGLDFLDLETSTLVFAPECLKDP